MIWRVCKWENGASTDFTKYLGAPIFYEDRLDERLDSGEFVLESMPTDTYGKAFPPKTKFRLEYGDYVGETFSAQKKYDVVVDHDDVEFYEGAPEICCHRVTFIEASVVAQGMHVDNIALTYELQDVDLNYKTIVSDDDIIGNNLVATSAGYPQAIRQSDRTGWTYAEMNEAALQYRDTKYCYFKNSYRYVWDNDSLNSIKSLNLRVDASEQQTISFTVPKLYCQGCFTAGVWTNLFEMNTVTTVTEYKFLGNFNIVAQRKVLLNNVSEEFVSGATNFDSADNAVCKIQRNASGNKSAFLRTVNINNNGYNYYVYTDKSKISKDDGFNNENYWTTGRLTATSNSNYTNVVTFNTSVLSFTELEQGYSYRYEINVQVKSPTDDGLVRYYEAKWESYFLYYSGEYRLTVTDKGSNTQNVGAPIYAYATIYAVDQSIDAEGGPFLRRAKRYNAYELFKKALLTVDTKTIQQIITVSGNNVYATGESLDDIEYPIVVDDEWQSVLENTQLYESTYEQKNLWEVLIQIGYYLHAIPYLEFAEDGNRFVLKFKKLGSKDNVTEQKGNQKITVFNSHNLSEYFSQFDAYATNAFSPQNVVEEWIVPKTSDSSFLVSNDTAELQTKYPILEIEEVKVKYNNSDADITEYVFEQSVYNVLTNDNPAQVIPAKGNSLYYTLAQNKILGLNYVAPSTNNDNLMALKYILGKEYGIANTAGIKFNEFQFYVRYRTQDSFRLTKFRPDLYKYIKNSDYEIYPHHEQFYGQQDKIVDSERFSKNLYGQLIRVGNGVYQCQEYTNMQNMKEGGDLITIENEPYYVVEVANEFYPDDIVLQKVTYSKNFNQLAQIVTIPSEPRFYEVSERSMVRREVRIQEFFKLGTETNTEKPMFMGSNYSTYLKQWIFDVDRTLPNYAYTRFLADCKKQHITADNIVIPPIELFPSSLVDRSDENQVVPEQPNYYAENIVPLLHFPIHDGIVFEWDMDDNFKVGDFIDTDISDNSTNVTVDKAYYAQQSLRYVDIMGRADMFKFMLFNLSDNNNNIGQILPRASIGGTNLYPNDSSDAIIATQGDNTYIALSKDNREALSFNYQINLLHDNDFITFPNVFGKKDSELKICFLSEEIGMFDELVSFSSGNIILDNVSYSLDFGTEKSLKLHINDSGISNANKSLIKSIILYQTLYGFGRSAYIARNVGSLDDDLKLQDWVICPLVFQQ